MDRSLEDRGRLAAVVDLEALGAYDLSAEVAAQPRPQAVFREPEVKEVREALTERRSVLLLGPHGVGKTAIIREAARRLLLRARARNCRAKSIVQMSTGEIIGSALNTGDWMGNLMKLRDVLIETEDIALFIANIAHLRDAGRYSGHDHSLSTAIKPYLERGQIVLIGEITHEEFTRSRAGIGERHYALADDHALLRNFKVVRVDRPDAATTEKIAAQVARQIGRTHHIAVHPDAIGRALEITDRFQSYQHQPGKAVALLGAAASRVRGKAQTLLPDDVVQEFCRTTGLPALLVSDSLALDPDDVQTFFSQRIIGQPAAVATLVKTVNMVKAGLQDPQRPLATLVFAGPTGNGKTLAASVLADFLFGSPRRLVRFDMSEFILAESASVLATAIVREVQKQPMAVILFDELEKGTLPVFDLFIQICGEGRITDPHGHFADLRNCILIFTSNLGSDRLGYRPAGFVQDLDPDHGAGGRVEIQKALERTFRPELVNRFDVVVPFRLLDRADVRRIVAQQLAGIAQREGLLRRGLTLHWDELLMDWLVDRGFDPRYGARPLQRAIHDHVLAPIAARLAAEPALGNRTIRLIPSGDSLTAEL